MISIDAISFIEYSVFIFLFGFLVGITYKDWKAILRKASEMIDTFEGKTEEEAIAKGIASGVDEFVGNEFCDDDCLGWDGEDRRCYCGNRRVSWQTKKYDDGTWHAWAEAW